MTDEQLARGQEYQRKIKQLTEELDKFSSKRPAGKGINIYLPDMDTLIEDVKQVFIEHLNDYKDKFKKL